MSPIAKFNVEKFDGSNEFGLWRVKMRCLLIQHGWEAVLDPFSKIMGDAEKTAALKTYVYKKNTVPYFCVWITRLSKKEQIKPTGFVKKNAGQSSGMHSEGYENGDLLMAVSEEMFLEWIMDSGGSYHMTPKRDFLFDFKEFNGGTVLLGDNRACAIKGTGKVKVHMKDGSSFVLENVRYIPELKRNFISLGTLDQEGYTVKLQNERVKIQEGNEGVHKPRYKARLVARGFTQQAGIDYNDVFSHVVQHTSIKVILSITACKDYELEQLDVKTVFLHGNFKEAIYMRQPLSFEEATSNKDFAPGTGPARKILGMEVVRDRVYGRDQRKHVDVDSFVDAHYAKDPDKGRSIIGYMFMVHGYVVSWKATLQHVVPLSTTEAEYMMHTEAFKESIWLKRSTNRAGNKPKVSGYEL
ncbi:retrovirus-related pol polyprotein from transposon TNT 1-94 [Tanacetum coccineum]